MIDDVLKLLFVILIVRHVYVNYRSAKRSINAWVAENELKILSRERRFLNTGPYILFQRHSVYKMVVQFPNGEEKICWIQCNKLFGFSPDYFEVRFENSLRSSSVDNDLHSGTRD